MIRTQVYLPKKLYEDVKLKARASGVPAAEVMRTLIGNGLAERQAHVAGGGGIAKLAKLNITGGPKDLAGNLDNYLYDTKP